MKKKYGVTFLCIFTFTFLLFQYPVLVKGDGLNSLRQYQEYSSVTTLEKKNIFKSDNLGKLNLVEFEYGYDIAVDNSGYAYIVGSTSNPNFPIINGFQRERGGIERNDDVFIAKIDTYAVGEASLVYSTYLGGDEKDGGYGIAVDDKGFVYITGITFSSNFPVKNHFQEFQDGFDAFFTIIDTNKTGTSSLVYSTFIGGNNEDSGQEVTIDKAGYAYIVGYTNSTDFPILNGYQTDPKSYHRDAFLTKIDCRDLDPHGSFGIVYSTYLGGNDYDYGYSVAADNDGVAYITGETSSSDFPVFDGIEYAGEIDVFMAKIDTKEKGQSSLLYSSCFGGTRRDYGHGIDIDEDGNAFITGHTASWDLPTINGFQNQKGGWGVWDSFLVKINTNISGKPGLVYSTYLGGGDQEFGRGITVDDYGYVYVTGKTSSSDFPTKNGFQETLNGWEDAFVIKVDTKLSGSQSIMYSSFMGGSNSEYGRGIAIDDYGYIYITGDTQSPDFPTLNEYQKYQGDYDVFVLKLDTNKSGQSGLLYSSYLGGWK